MPKKKERKHVLAQEHIDAIRLKWPNLRDAMRALHTHDVMTTDAFYRVVRGEPSTWEEVDTVKERLVFGFKKNYERADIVDALTVAAKHLGANIKKKVSLIDLIRDIKLHDDDDRIE